MPPTNGTAPICSFLGSSLISTKLIFLAIVEANNKNITKPITPKKYDCKDSSGPSERDTVNTRKYSAKTRAPIVFKKIKILLSVSKHLRLIDKKNDD